MIVTSSVKVASNFDMLIWLIEEIQKWHNCPEFQRFVVLFIQIQQFHTMAKSIAGISEISNVIRHTKIS